MVLKYNQLIKQHLSILRNLQYESGLFAASKKRSRTGYNKSWLRDNFYECLAFQVLGDWNTVFRTYKAIIKIFGKHEYKIDCAISKKPEHTHEYIHARYHPQTFDEYWEDWGNKQNDSVGDILFAVGNLMKHKKKILKTKRDYRIVQKLVDYLSTLEYWHDEDSGMWEEGEEVHASSIGACVAGLKEISKIKRIHVDKKLIKNGEKALRKILPRESEKKFVDLALLSLIWPYEVTTKRETEKILKNVTYHLERNKGVIRYKNDHYYNKNPDGYSEEAEWSFGFSWLAIIYDKLGKLRLARKYEKLALSTATEKGIPELYFSQTDKYNPNTPLGWAESLFIIALYNINAKYKEETKKSIFKIIKPV